MSKVVVQIILVVFAFLFWISALPNANTKAQTKVHERMLLNVYALLCIAGIALIHLVG